MTVLEITHQQLVCVYVRKTEISHVKYVFTCKQANSGLSGSLKFKPKTDMNAQTSGLIVCLLLYCSVRR